MGTGARTPDFGKMTPALFSKLTPALYPINPVRVQSQKHSHCRSAAKEFIRRTSILHTWGWARSIQWAHSSIKTVLEIRSWDIELRDCEVAWLDCKSKKSRLGALSSPQFGACNTSNRYSSMRKARITVILAALNSRHSIVLLCHYFIGFYVVTNNCAAVLLFSEPLARENENLKVIRPPPPSEAARHWYNAITTIQKHYNRVSKYRILLCICYSINVFV